MHPWYVGGKRQLGILHNTTVCVGDLPKKKRTVCVGPRREAVAYKRQNTLTVGTCLLVRYSQFWISWSLSLSSFFIFLDKILQIRMAFEIILWLGVAFGWSTNKTIVKCYNKIRGELCDLKIPEGSCPELLNVWFLYVGPHGFHLIVDPSLLFQHVHMMGGFFFFFFNSYYFTRPLK